MALIRNTPADDSTCGWFHLSPPRVARARHSGISATRWAVVGAGFTGLAAARQLALNFPDDEIVLIEAQEVGYGASGRNAGFAIDLPHDIGAEDYIGDIATARISMELNLAGQSMLRALVEQHGIDCQWRDCGKYQAAIEDRGIAVLDAYRRGLDKLGQAYQVIDAADLPSRIGTDVMGQVDGKTGVAPGSAVADLLGFDQHDLVIRKIQRQLTRRRKAGEPRPDHGPARRADTAVARACHARWAEVKPATG